MAEWEPCVICDSPDLGELCPVHDFGPWRDQLPNLDPMGPHEDGA